MNSPHRAVWVEHLTFANPAAGKPSGRAEPPRRAGDVRLRSGLAEVQREHQRTVITQVLEVQSVDHVAGDDTLGQITADEDVIVLVRLSRLRSPEGLLLIRMEHPEAVEETAHLEPSRNSAW